jgi:AcrR family transcriptional regulator
MTTKEKITQKALELFNQNGIEYVGMRELAASMNMKIGNITYYFPTKNDLVNQLATNLSALNAETLAPSEDLTMLSFLHTMENVFRNQQRYRCLFLSFVHLVKQNPSIAERYKIVENDRRSNFYDKVISLQMEGYLNLKSKEEINFLGSAISLIARFWISEAAISDNSMPAENQAYHYSKLIAQMFIPYTLEAGRKQIDVFFDRTQNELTSC